jgi:squalene-hopene/tetraprenyl-beta-curcumene cyclase
MDPQLREKARRAVDGGLHYLRGQQAENGSVMNSVGITALSLRAFLEAHRGYNEGDGAFITKQVEYLLSKVNDGDMLSKT